MSVLGIPWSEFVPVNLHLVGQGRKWGWKEVSRNEGIREHWESEKLFDRKKTPKQWTVSLLSHSCSKMEAVMKAHTNRANTPAEIAGVATEAALEDFSPASAIWSHTQSPRDPGAGP